MNDEAIEQEIIDKGLTAPRLTPQLIASVIDQETYIIPGELVTQRGGQLVFDSPLNLLTICVLVLKNGFTVTGTSACVSPENFDQELGRKIARQKAVDQIWLLEGYRLRQKLFEDRS